MGTENRVLPKDLEKAMELEEERRECMRNQQLLYKQMEQENKNAYVELHALYQKQIKRDLEISKELSAMYFKKMKKDSSKESKDVLDVADRLEAVGGRKEVVEVIRRNA
ncbi:hypothetical protein [Bacillus cereus group sp. N3]|uniref:hypothetical protein n=1 Tax=Bacillus cereus group sp. N3 TaxID=2794582 RepID=UPI0018F5479B|nr:hypothetical protein [Bacillus cereus group sp. N3]MBJ8128931.1 hypothetical protein [Bacillus cereus group sp. N3]